MKITDEVFQVGGQGLASPEDAAIYLIKFGDHAALVDAGCGRSPDRLFRNIKACGTDPGRIEYLLITHCHLGRITSVPSTCFFLSRPIFSVRATTAPIEGRRI